MSIIRLAASVLSACLVFALVGVGAETVARQGDERAHPPPGQIIDVHGQPTHLACYGPNTQPAVVFVAGLGESSLTWIEVQRLLMPRMRVCAYDRPGYGWTPPRSGPHDIDTSASQLHDLLEVGAVEPPYVLVGHSYGSWIVRSFAARYPEALAGGVLVDPLDPASLYERDDSGMRGPLTYRLLELSGWIGITRLVGDSLATRVLPPDAPGLVKREATWLYRKEVAQAALAELDALDDSARILGELDDAAVWAEQPLAVISSADSTQEDRRFDAVLAARSPSGRLILARAGGGYVHYSDPRLVADAIAQTVKRG